MSNFKIAILPTAIEDIADIYEYISVGLQVPQTACVVADRIFNAINSLDFMPKRFPFYETEYCRDREIRKIIVDNYIILYCVDDTQKEVTVLNVFYGGRDIKEIVATIGNIKEDV